MRSACFVVALALSACDSGKGVVPEADVLPPLGAVGGTPRADADIEPNAGRVRLMHLSNDAGPVDVYVDNEMTPIVEDLRFTDGTPYVSVPIGDRTFGIAPAGGPFEEAVVTVGLEVVDGMDYTIATYGTIRNQSLGMLTLTDDLTDLGAGDLRVQIAHVADGFEAVDLFVMDEEEPLVPGLAFGTSQSLDGPGGPLRIGIGLDQEDPVQDFAFSVPDFGSDRIVDLFAVQTRGRGVMFAALLADGEVSRLRYDPRVRLLHAAPTVSEIDLMVGGSMEPAFANLGYGEGTSYLTFPAADTSFQVALAGAMDPLVTFERSLRVGRSYTAVAYGGDTPMIKVMVHRVIGLEPENTRYKVLNGGENIGAFDLVDDVSGDLLLEGLEEGRIGQLDLPAGTQAFGIDVARDGLIDGVFELPDFGPDTLVDLVVVMEDGGNPRILAHLPDGTGMMISPR